MDMFKEAKPGNRELLETYLNRMDNNGRYKSFDLCYQHFRTHFRNLDKSMIDPEKSCAIMSAFLASWGMMRASSFLFKHNYRILRPVIDYIAGLDESCWEIDLVNYPQNYDRILEIYRDIKGILVPNESQGKTLVTKIMLGVFGMIPAFDENFTTFMREQATSTCKFRSFNKDALESIYYFYKKNKELVEELNQDERVRVIDFDENRTDLKYSMAKVIDMIGFIGGEVIIKEKRALQKAQKQN